MKRILYTYMNKEDMKHVMEFFKSKGVYFWNRQKELIEELPAIVQEYTECYCGYKQGTMIVYIPCCETKHHIREAIFVIENPDAQSLKLFDDLKKYIRKNYVISSDKTFYVGQSIYEDWMNNKYQFMAPVRYEKFMVEKENINAIFEELLEMDCKIKNQCARLRNMDVLDLKSETFVVFFDSSKMITTVLRRSFISYEWGSQCVFVGYQRKKKKYTFLIDQRIADDKNSEIAVLYEKIKEKWAVG